MRGAGTANATAISSPAATAALENAGPVPTWSAIAPTTGPNRAPPTAAPMAVPISSPRRSGGASVASQAIPPAQVHAPPTPCTNRAETSTTSIEAHPKTSVDTPISASPSRTVFR